MEIKFKYCFIQRDITDEELNEIMEEIEQERIGVEDQYPLKNIRKAALNA